MPAMIAEEITEQLRLNLTNAEQRRLTRRLTDNADAYRLLSAGTLLHFNKLTAEGSRERARTFSPGD